MGSGGGFDPGSDDEESHTHDPSHSHDQPHAEE